MTDDVERLSRRRAAIWAGAPEDFAGEVQFIAARLAELYEARRASRGRDRGEVVRRARIESELERLVRR